MHKYPVIFLSRFGHFGKAEFMESIVSGAFRPSGRVQRGCPVVEEGSSGRGFQLAFGSRFMILVRLFYCFLLSRFVVFLDFPVFSSAFRSTRVCLSVGEQQRSLSKGYRKAAGVVGDKRFLIGSMIACCRQWAVTRGRGAVRLMLRN